jgi:hypothetical protein
MCGHMHIFVNRIICIICVILFDVCYLLKNLELHVLNYIMYTGAVHILYSVPILQALIQVGGSQFAYEEIW